MQSGQLSASERTKLITLLPRMRRFATVLAGERQGADELLRVACKKMLHSANDYQRGTAFDIWAFGMLHTDWLAALRSHATPLAQTQGDSTAFEISEIADDEDHHLVETMEIVAQLPAQQRSAALLIYGEGFSYEEAANILDTSPQTVMARLSRALSTFVERADWLESSRQQSAEIQRLNQMNRQAG